MRLVKDSRTGEGSFLPVESEDQVIRLAGQRAAFDLAEWGVPARMIDALDITTQLAVAAGLEALRDAGIPLVKTYKTTATGKKVPTGWGLPEALRDGTGIIFASAFPGYSRLVEKLANNGADAEGHFDRRFLFQVLSMGHSQFAQMIGARGPNTAVNAARASTTQALSLAEDWIRLGRADRVLVIGADDVTNEHMLQWFGGGFMAAGAATTEKDVEKAALPFDARRHGMILGMGAVGLVVERADLAASRGVHPIGTLLSSVMVNSAFHGTRLDREHIASAMHRAVQQACDKVGVSPGQMAARAMFMSHETYTPARGGSAGAEISSLREAFGDASSQVTIANTKGFTGHPMGAGIEDAIALKALQYGIIPPIPNFREPDPELGDLRLSMGERREDLDFAIRLAAGFGSQLAISVWKKAAHGDQRLADASRRLAWLREISGFSAIEEVIGDRTLRLVESTGPDRMLPLEPEVSPAIHTRLASDGAAPIALPDVRLADEQSPAADPSLVMTELVALIAQKTGYDTDELEPDFELEADLGIDTVKQAEIFSELRERYGIERDDSFRFADYPTIESLGGYLAAQVSASSTPERSMETDDTTDAVPAPPPVPEVPRPSRSGPSAMAMQADLVAYQALGVELSAFTKITCSST